MDGYTKFFVFAGLWSVTWNLCKFMFWLDDPKRREKK